MKSPLLRVVRIAVWSSMLAVAVIAGCAAPTGDEVTEHPACELEPQTLPALSTESHDHEHGDENVGTTSEALSISCKMSPTKGYKSGSPFSIKVVTVDGKKVEWKTANAFYKMAKAAKKDGVNIAVVSGFRSMSEQQYLYNCYKCGCCNGGNLAAVPGYSNHQSGHALDLNTSSPGVYSWLSKHGHKYGFKRTVPSEPWHWEWWGQDKGQGPCNAKTLKAKLTKKSSNAKKFRGKKADYIVCAGKKFELSFTFKNKGTATWRDVKGRGKTMGSDVFLVTANGKKDKLTGKKRVSVRQNKNSYVRGDKKAKNCSTKKGCKSTTFIKGGLQAKAPKKTGIYTSKWRLRDYSKLHGKQSKGFGPKAQLRVKVVKCESGACGCSVWCTDGSKKKLPVDSASECKAQGAKACAPSKYLSHDFNKCAPPGGGSGGTGGSSGGTAGTGGSSGSWSTGGASGSGATGSGGSAGETGGGDPIDGDDSDTSFPPEGEEDPNAIETTDDDQTLASGTEEEDDPEFEEDPSFEGEDDGVEGGEGEALAEQGGCSVAPVGARSSGGLAALGLLGLGLAWRVARRRVRR